VEDVEGRFRASTERGGGVIRTESSRQDRSALAASNLNALTESILELRKAVEQRLRATRLYIAKAQVDEFLELIRQPEPFGSLERYPTETRHATTDNPRAPTLEEPKSTENPGPPRIEPIKRGGGRFHPIESETTHRSSGIHVELIAYYYANVWQVLLEAKAGEGKELTVYQNDVDLDAGRSEIAPSTFGPLRSTSPIRIRWKDAFHAEKLLDWCIYPIFFQVIESDFARRIARPSLGLNLAVVPQNWEYVEERSGPPPHEMEACSIPGCVVHYFSPARSQALTFKPPERDAIEFRLSKPRFRLDGCYISDEQKKLGPIFVGPPPQLQGVNGGVTSARTVVVGREGRGVGKWRCSYKLDKGNISGWPLPDDILNQGSGWYFVRLYDSQDGLIDSLDFRYIPRLQNINVKLPKLTDSSDEQRISVEFVHEAGVSVTRLGSSVQSISSSLGVQSGQDLYRTTKFEWPQSPHIREVSFRVDDGGMPVPVTFETDRVWWALVYPQQEIGVHWQSASIHVPNEAFLPESDIELRVRFPLSSVMEAFVGFEHTSRRALRYCGAEGMAVLRLHEFSEAEQLKTLGTHNFLLWLRDGDEEIQLNVINVTVERTCRWCGLRTASQDVCLDHVLGKHHDVLFERLELREEETAERALPNAVFICMECGQTYPKDPRSDRNATSLMLRHFDLAHPNCHPHFKRVDEPATLQNLFALPRKIVWRCMLGNCDPLIPTTQDERATSDKKAHLGEHHLGQLFCDPS
jgi:hypothetical protein